MTDGAGRDLRGAYRELLGRGAVYTVATALQLAAAVIALPIVTRLLDAAAYGRVAIAMILAQALTFVVANGFAVGIPREHFEAGGAAVARRLVGAGALAAVAVAVVAHVSGRLWAPLLGSGYDAVLQLAVLIGAAQGVLDIAQSQLRVAGRVGRFVTASLLRTVGGPALGVALVAITGEGATAFLWGVAAASAASAGLALLLGRAGRPQPGDVPAVRRTLRVGLPTIPHSLALLMVAGVDRVLVERYHGAEAAGRYYVAYVVGTLPILLVQAFNNAWSPLVLGAGAQQGTLLADTTAKVVVAAGAAGAAVAVAAPVLLALSAPGEYQPGELVHIAAVVALSAPVFASYTASVLCLIAAGRTASLMWITPAVAVVNVALNVALLPSFGLAGAAVATVAAYATQAVLVRRASGRVAVVPWRPVADGWAIAITSAGALLSWVVPEDWWALRLVVAVAIVVAVLAATRRLISRPATTEPVPA